MKSAKLFAAFLTVLLVSSSVSAAPENPWNLRKDEDGIKVWTRKVDGSPIDEFKSVMTVDVPQEKVFAFYEQVDRYKDWFYQCSSARILEEKGNERLIYYVMDMPWPVSDRDSVYVRTKSAEPDGTLTVRLAAKPDAYPKQPGMVRVPYLKVLWHFKALPGGKTEIYFQEHCDSGGHIPSSLVNALCVGMPFKTLQKLRQLVSA